MKPRFILIISAVTLMLSQPLEAQQRQKVYSIVKQAQTTEWYSTQAKLWGERLETHPQDAQAWDNYYSANRMMKIQGGGKTQEDLNKIVKDMEEAIPNTFEFHYVTYWNGGASEGEKNFHHLEKAHELGPNRPELISDFVTHYMVQSNASELNEWANKWFKANDISPGLYSWCYNMMQSCDDDAILLTCGDNDTYPVIILQQVKQVRKDIAPMNTFLLTVDTYREPWFDQLAIPQMEKSHDDYESMSEFQEDIINHIIEHTDRPVYFSMGTPRGILAPVKDQLYNVGLASKYSTAEFDNIAVIKRNYEKRFMLDYLQQSFVNDVSQGVVNHMNANYLASMLVLYNHYKESEDTKLVKLRGLIDHIAKINDMEEDIAGFFKCENNLGNSKVITHPKEIMKEFVKVSDKFYGGKTEVTMGMYELFLSDLLRQHRFDELNRARLNPVDWRALVGPEMAKLTDDELFQHGNPSSEKFPVVNITHEAALLYCQWLTDVYNTMDHRKKAFEKVTFRLPNESEWKMMASVDGKYSPYPWGGPYIRNAKGCFLANINTSEVVAPKDISDSLAACPNIPGYSNDLDGGIIPVVAESYMPNDYGLFNLCGNVAEMLNKEGVTMGGSWNTLAGVATIDQKETYKDKSPEVGFRVIMVVEK